MALTFEVNNDKSVTIYNDGGVFSHQFDDPEVEGYDAFASKARATEWAEAAIVRYQAEIEAEAEKYEDALAAHEAEVARQAALAEEQGALFAGVEAEAAADSEELAN
jgi:hypothetical protein